MCACHCTDYVDKMQCVPVQSVEGVLGNNNYQHNKVNQWTSAVVEQCLNQLTKLAKPFKYIGMYMYCQYYYNI